MSNPAFAYLAAPQFVLQSVNTSTVPISQVSRGSISATFNIAVTARGEDIFIPKTGAFKVYSVLNNDLPGTLVSSTVYQAPSNTAQLTNSYRVSQDTTATFVVNSTYLVTGPIGQYDLRMEEIDWGTSDTAASSSASTYMANDFISGYEFLQ